jgi:anaerobic selenocysteine-containing dehydrogenase
MVLFAGQFKVTMHTLNVQSLAFWSSVMATSQVLPSVCPLDWPETCSLSATIQDGRLVAVKGSRANPYTAGAVCEKVAKSYPESVHGDKRLTQPLVRTGARGSGEFRAVTWDETLDRIHADFSAAIAQHGPQSVLPFNYAGPYGQLAGGSMDRRFFHRLGASVLDRGPWCGAVRSGAYSALFGQSPGIMPEQAADADVVAVWGNNATVSNLHFQRIVQTARSRGAQLVVVDPKRTRIAVQAQLFVQIRPGTDVVLAMAAELERRGAFDQTFIERWVEGVDAFMAEARQYTVAGVVRGCRVSAAQFSQLVAIYAGAQRLAVAVGNGIERGHSGGSGLRAIMSLNALLGQLGRLGRLGIRVIAKPNLAVPATSARLQRPDLIPPGTRTINIVDVGQLLLDELLDIPIKALFIYNHTPVCTHLDQSSAKRTNATFGGGLDSAGVEVLEMHPHDAGARDIVEGDAVRVWNALGEVELRATISDAMQPGVVYSPKGMWLHSSSTGQTVNALLSADIRTDIFDGACYHDTFAQVEHLRAGLLWLWLPVLASALQCLSARYCSRARSLWHEYADFFVETTVHGEPACLNNFRTQRVLR